MLFVSIINDELSNIIPVFNHFKDEITTHIIFYERNNISRRNFKTFIIEHKKYCEINNIDIVYNELDDNITISKELILNTIADNNKNNLSKIMFNITEVNPALVIILNYSLLNSDFIVYDKFTNIVTVMNNGNIINTVAANKLNLEEHFKYKNLKIINNVNEEDIHRRKSAVSELFSNSESYRKFKNIISKPNIEIDTLKWSREIDILKTINKESDIKYITGGAFEEYIYIILKELEYFDDIKLGIEILIDEETNLRNEFDIVAIKNNHVYLIECKFRDNMDETEILYKLDSVLDIVDDESKGMIISLSNRDREISKKNIEKRAHINNIFVYIKKNINKNDLVNNVLNFFKHN
jgi:hypothetical protein